MDDFWYDISQLWVGTFFYGIYLVLFCICIYVLLHRPHNLGNTVLLVTAAALFTLSTVQAIINLVLGAADIDNIDIPYNLLVNVNTVIYGINNIIADGLVIYRCYSVWNKNIYIVIPPILLLIPTSVFGIAGRIWWIHRKARAYLEPAMQQRYTSAISILVESGVIYSATVLAYLILGAIPSANIVQEPIFQMLTQVLGIAPTLIIVRVGLGVSVQSVESAVRTAVATSDSEVRPHHILGIPANSPDLEKEIPAPPMDLEDGRHESFEKRRSEHGSP
ncbi:hypothetical protein C8F04DRAFT_1134553 [Mycena alexandri]|uniref:Uncharacterized protein n=1 Tax=Mycena alexandri TaxID=1745969 RepID=A0AAD6S9X1_9AGAR|nr:hypothetical protein C8F04DRAFT_1134553 [Mycena alexandri]